jgi:exodeoxyribonuclease VII large subunit
MRLASARAALMGLAGAKLQRHRARIQRAHGDACRQLSARVHRSKSSLHRRHVELTRLLMQRVTRERSRVERLTASLAALDPTAVLDRGYAILSDERGKVVSSIADARRERKLTIRLRDGDLIVHVPRRS